MLIGKPRSKYIDDSYGERKTLCIGTGGGCINVQ